MIKFNKYIYYPKNLGFEGEMQLQYFYTSFALYLYLFISFS